MASPLPIDTACTPALGHRYPENTSHSSFRTPRMHSGMNDADWIDRTLSKDSHAIWGFVIFCCDDYAVPAGEISSHPAWQKLLSALQLHARKGLESYNGSELWGSFRLTVIEDAATLKNASTETVRQEFVKWGETVVEQEQGGGMEMGESPRYRYCVRVSQDVLDCWEGDEEGHFVDLIWRDWERDWEVYPSYRLSRRAADRDENDHLESGSEGEEIEGSRKKEVGWMRVSVKIVVRPRQVVWH
ncbi:hypothetical protein QBC44DRAFT_373687 [Cladorrhinum sp. PSN332]|nr:hypothetical protein QBC44DRAFT_373687 [Cladorrhinum sp. PSN332]